MKRKYLPELLILFCGLFFIISALVKIIDFESFTIQVSYYGIIKQSGLVRNTALMVVALETALGFILLLQLWWEKFSIPVAILVLLSYCGIVIFAWYYHGLEDCGCFGSYIKMTPMTTIIKNLIMIMLLIYAYFKLYKFPKQEDEKLSFPLATLTKIMIVLLLTGIGTTYAGISNYRNHASQNETANSQSISRPFSAFHILEKGELINLGNGIYFIAMLSMTCPHCAKSVGSLNELSGLPGFPKVVGLCLGEDTSYEKFIQDTHPNFPLQLIDHLKFMELIKAKPPRFFLVMNGKPYQYWDYELPEIPQILEAMSKLPQTSVDTTNPSD